ncbi:ornithine cyclodeaminase family protein [Halanaeroarchaeum sulfurireducens]|uniref:Alanine dehydrogenase n=1 Tax=Halanaeroarchaeum sulfurireducens TaxID=1604004 RepID=A0A0F7PG07_9EURY|nr:alanine dehydrogenase [Halanaeroarchaeum sulfurireducens]AKH98499.1 ornithine cyclodeaminase [Halanaeroarchaeum sulfurireducens]
MDDRSTLILPSDVVDEAMPMDALVDALEDAFAAYARGDANMPPKSYIDLPQYNGDFRSMPAYLDVTDWDAAGIKWVNVHPDNPDDHDLPTVMGTVIYSDPETAYPLAIMDGTVLTNKRTGAAAGVATDHLAAEDASSLGLIGAGNQAHTQLEAISQIRDIEEVVVSDVDAEAVQAFVDAYDDGFAVRGGTVGEAAHCDILSTVTPVESPIVSPEDVGDHTHINAMGADAEGKHELADDLLLNAKLVIDDYEQCTHSGEINVPWSAGVLDDAHLYGELGDVVTGEIAGRTAEDGVTVFDSTGLAIQDIVAAHVVYEHARDHDIGTDFDLMGV